MGFISGIKYKYSRKSAENPFSQHPDYSAVCLSGYVIICLVTHKTILSILPQATDLKGTQAVAWPYMRPKPYLALDSIIQVAWQTL